MQVIVEKGKDLSKQKVIVLKDIHIQADQKVNRIKVWVNHYQTNLLNIRKEQCQRNQLKANLEKEWLSIKLTKKNKIFTNDEEIIKIYMTMMIIGQV